MGDFYRVPADTRDLNYGKFFTEGDPAHSRAEEYHSHNAQRLDLPAIQDLLLTLDCVRSARIS